MRNFFHGSAVGRSVVDGFWKTLGGDVMSLMAFDAHPETAKLKPWTDAMFTGPSFSILNYETDFFQLVKDGKIKIYISEIDHLSPGTVHLVDGTSFASDVFLANTGWKHAPPMKFLPEGIDRELGLPHTPGGGNGSGSDSSLASQQDLVDRADEEILKRFPRLKRQPVWNKNYVPLTATKGVSAPGADAAQAPGRPPTTPFMLHRFMAPASARLLRARDVAFVGMVSNFSNIITAHLQGLWVSAYFAGRLADDPAAAAGDDARMADLRYQTVLHNRFGHWRYPTDWGSRYPSFIFDAVPYLDLLLRDLGLPMHRKGGRMAEIYDPYGPEDYRTVNEEWLDKYGNAQSAV